jgi:hypothetical protein
MDARGAVVHDGGGLTGDRILIQMNEEAGLYLWRLTASDGAEATGRFVLP